MHSSRQQRLTPRRAPEVLVTSILRISIVLIGTTLLSGGVLLGQQVVPPPGYYDIPAGYDFPAEKQTLEQYRSTANVTAQRLHVWNVYAGMTQRTPDDKYAIWETWYSEDETFQTGPTPQAITPRRIVRRFRQPAQFRSPPGAAAPQAAGTALLSFVLYNFAGYNHIRSSALFSTTVLKKLQQTGTPDPRLPTNRTIPPFPANAVALKTIWWPVAKDKLTPMPVWDPAANPPRPGGNPFTTWARVVAIDPTRPNISAEESRTVTFAGRQFPNSHVVGLNSFHSVILDAQAASNAMQNGLLGGLAQQILGRGLQAGDIAVFTGTHLTTKEIDDWVWATFWWHDRPSEGPYASDRPDSVKGVWRNYLMNASYDLNLPRATDSGPHVTFNPWLEARFPNGQTSNCMACHQRASYPPIAFLPVTRGDADLKNDPAFAGGRLRADFLWSIPDQSQ
jgi:hypothetical protein